MLLVFDLSEVVDATIPTAQSFYFFLSFLINTPTGMTCFGIKTGIYRILCRSVCVRAGCAASRHL